MASHRITSAIASSAAAIASAARSIPGFADSIPEPTPEEDAECRNKPGKARKNYDFTSPTSLSTLRTRTCSSLRNLAKASPGM